MGLRLASALIAGALAFAFAAPAMAQVVRENQVLQPPSQSDNGSRDAPAPEGNGARSGKASRTGPGKNDVAIHPADDCLADTPTGSQCGAGIAAGSPAGARFLPDAPRTVAPLNAAGIAACENEIRALQTESQTWQGTLDEISLRLGMMQRTLYAGRCAGHPQAAALVADAQQILVTASPRVAAVHTRAEQTSTPVIDCVEPVPPGDARNPTGVGIFRNTCAFPVYFSYCNVAPKAGSWAEQFACETRANIALDVVAANGYVPAALGRQISHFACRKPALPVATYTPANGLEGYCK